MAHIINVLVEKPAVPLSPTAQALADNRSKREADALKAWRQAVKLVAKGEPLAAKQAEALAAAQFDLGRRPEQFDRDVAAWKEYGIWAERLTKEPTEAEQQAKLKGWAEQSQALLERVEKLKAEQRELVRLYTVMPSHWNAVNVNFERTKQAVAELLADD